MTTDFAAIDTAYKNAEWAEIFCLLDEHFGGKPTVNYNILKKTITGFLQQGQQPNEPSLQGLKSLIDDITKTSSPLPQSVALYQYYLQYPIQQVEDALINRFKANNKQELVDMLYIHGKSKPIKAISCRSNDRKFLWFIEHLLPDYFALAKTQHTLVEFMDTRMISDEFLLIEHICKCLEYTSYSDIDENNCEAVVNDIKKYINDKLDNGFLVIPIFIRPQSSLAPIKPFFDKYLPNMIEGINVSNKKHSMVFLFLFQDEDTVVEKCETCCIVKDEVIKFNNVDEDCLKRWVGEHRRNFFNDNEELCTKFNEAYSDNALQFVDITLEELFEKITQHIFPDLNFSQFLKSNYPHHKISR